MAGEALDRFLALSEELAAAIDRLVEAASAYLRTSGYETTTRDRVLTALCVKIAKVFRALVDDCRARRSESMHHLKTMVEAFIYYYVVAKDSSDQTAELVLAEAVARPFAARLRDIGAPESQVTFWQEIRSDLSGEARGLDKLEALAAAHGTALKGWYASVYRLACESAHIGDLFTLMPAADGSIPVRESSIDIFRATAAINYGAEIVVAMFESISEMTEETAGLHVPTDTFRASLELIRREEFTAGTGPSPERGGNQDE